MRKLYKEFFAIPENGKIHDKVMIGRLVITIVATIVCLATMGLSAYAYFSHDVISANNVIKAAHFETNVKIQITDETGEAVQVITSNHKSHLAELKANTKYFITLKPTERSTAKTGFVVVTAEGNSTAYHTQQLGVDGALTRDQITFCLILGADTKVTFLAHWGTSSHYGYNNDSEAYILQGETVLIPVNGIAPTTNGTNSTEVLHIVSEGENLTKIAEKYNTTLYHIAAYNNITDMNTIQIGSKLKIPPAGWEIPEGFDLQLVPVTPPPAAQETKPEPETKDEIPATTENNAQG